MVASRSALFGVAGERSCPKAAPPARKPPPSRRRRCPTEIAFTRPSIFASASTWMIFASFGQYSMPYCGSVPNGPRRVPSASTTSAFAMSFIAAFEPW